MKWQRFFLVFFLLPTLVYGLNKDQCNNLYAQIVPEWDKHIVLLSECEVSLRGTGEEAMQFLRESIACCQAALSVCDTLLTDIAGKSKKERKKSWCEELKAGCKEKKNILIKEIQSLESQVRVVEGRLALKKVNVILQDIFVQARGVAAKDLQCRRSLQNVEEVVSSVREIAGMYKELANIVQDAVQLIMPYAEQQGNVMQIRYQQKQYLDLAEQYGKEAIEWPAYVVAQKKILTERLRELQDTSKDWREQGMPSPAYALQKQVVAVLGQLVESSVGREREVFQNELEQAQADILAWEKEEHNRAENAIQLSLEEFRNREKQRRGVFFGAHCMGEPRDLLESVLRFHALPCAFPLDGQRGKTSKAFTLYTEQFYRFLVHSDAPIPYLFVQVSQEGKGIYNEKIALPVQNPLFWERYMTVDGMIFIPETKLHTDFGIDLRIQFVFDPKVAFSMIISQKVPNASYELSVSVEEGTSLYDCSFSVPPPWQLGAFCKPALPAVAASTGEACFVAEENSHLVEVASFSPKGVQVGPGLFFISNRDFIRQDPSSSLDSVTYPELDKLVEELRGDPLLLAQYVQQEISLIDPFLVQDEGLFLAPGIQRDPGTTYGAKAGSPWEQCHLLVYLLRKAGYQADVAAGGICALPKDVVENLLFIKLPESQEEVLLQYPWVVFSNGKEKVTLFPWLQQMQITEGYDLYNLMPAEYATADRWILQYLKGEESIVKHIGADGDDTAVALFSRCIAEELSKKGLSLADVGVQRTPLKKQCTSWADFPRPTVRGQYQIFNSVESIPGIFGFITLKIYSRENKSKFFDTTFSSVNLRNSTFFIRCEPSLNQECCLAVQGFDGLYKNSLRLSATDHNVDIEVIYHLPIGAYLFKQRESLSMVKGASAALCFHFGGACSEKVSYFYKKFSQEENEQKKLHDLLSFVGVSYFAKCGRSEQWLCDLHKMPLNTVCGVGLAEITPDIAKGSFAGEQDLVGPKVDMVWMCLGDLVKEHSVMWHEEAMTHSMQLQALLTVDFSSNEHQILREVFRDQYAVSTVKLLQMAHAEHKKKGLEGEGFLRLASSSLDVVNKTPEVAQSLYFSHLPDLSLRNMKTIISRPWRMLQGLLGTEDPGSVWAYAYMTPEAIASQGGAYQGMGVFILHPYQGAALISHNMSVLHGGVGSTFPPGYFTPYAMKAWELVPAGNGYTSSYTLQISPPSISSCDWKDLAPFIPALALPAKTVWSSDIRPWYKTVWNHVADPVDVVSGAFYVDETDLILPGPFSLAIRRNYNSQNPLMGHLGCGWKMGLNPFLVEQDGKRFIAELEGTVIAYRYNSDTSRWEVFPEDNPELFHWSQQGANPFHAYMENDILYGVDGSKRFFENGLLKKWIDAAGNSLIFSYEKERLSRIQSSNGDFCGFYYNHEGNIAEIYAKDGRRIYYNYNSQGDLVRVALPNTAVITYDYDHAHRMIRETKPHGKILENLYDEEGRVKEQKSPMGMGQEMIVTAAFTYADNETSVTDAAGGTTIYKIFGKQIYKIIDPLGYSTLQSWFIEDNSWFDPEIESVVCGEMQGGAARSLKSTTDKRGLITSYLYDGRGNLATISLQGQDLTGSGVGVCTKTFVFNDGDQCVEEEVDGQKTRITYDQTFPYLPKRKEIYRDNTLISYVEFTYNSRGLIEKEDHSGSITLWQYDSRSLPSQKIQVTGTEDPDVITTYAYNYQGQCVEVRSIEGVQKNVYDVMGCLIESKMFSSSGDLLSATYTGYDLNSQPIWKQTANPNNTLYLDYHASGLIKASRQTVSSDNTMAYTLYEYNACGSLIEEVDPLGYTTYREYDALGRVTSVTKQAHSTLFSYEPGGLVESVISPSGAKVERLYTTNGLVKEEIYSDGTKNVMVYDFLGRPIRETKNDITWEMTYDDLHRRLTRTQVATQITEIREFDAQENLIRFTDAAGCTLEKTYDHLHRIKTATSPSGEKTLWNYQGNVVICTLPNGEKHTAKYEGGRVVASEVVNAQGALVAVTSYRYDPKEGRQEVVQGEERTTTWMNGLGLPIAVQKGNIRMNYAYDVCGNCIAIIDGEGRTTLQTYDGLKRLTKKQLPDGGVVGYVYDLDSNITEYHLPSGAIWQACYDSMGRKTEEKLQAGGETAFFWEYTYEGGYLKEAKDPMQRSHRYQYDLSGRLVQEAVEGWERNFVYDSRGGLVFAEQKGETGSSFLPKSTKIERSYDPEGRLCLEATYSNSTLIQETLQDWGASRRVLQMGDHRREFIYQNKQLLEVRTAEVDLSYGYDLSGSLQSTGTPYSTTTMRYNVSGLPDVMHTQLADHRYEEHLEWYSSGRLAACLSSGGKKSFSYTDRGFLQSAGEEVYEFDFGLPGVGIRTAAPDRMVPPGGLDVFGKIVEEIGEEEALTTVYNAMGQVISQGGRQLDWDPWGRLIRITAEEFVWEASYDPLGRRLQTCYTPRGGDALITTSFYDPEEEFQEIGVQYGDKTFWKIYGPNACDAVTEEGSVVVLVHNALGQVAEIVSEQSVYYTEKFPSAYGSKGSALLPSDVLSYAQLLFWHSQAQDPTGLIWMGERYYDAQSGRFLSPDSVGYPICLDLYGYAGGDPINYMDPTGRFASPVYQAIKPVVMDSFHPLSRVKRSIQDFNMIPSYFANHELTRSGSFQVGSFDLPSGAIGFINGINNQKPQFFAHAEKLSQYAGGAKIYGTYNATNWDTNQAVSTAIDVIECGLGYVGIHTPPVQLLKNQWDQFIATHRPKEKFLQISHSGGAIHVYNALATSPPSVQQRIISLAFAPAAIIPEELCFKSYNYISRRDFVTYLDVRGNRQYGDQLQVLEPHPDAHTWDHEFLSPTFAKTMQRQISSFLTNYGGGR